MLKLRFSLITLALTSTLSLLPAATPGIGVAVSNGSVTVNNAVVPGNATLFDGNTIETGQMTSRLQLRNGKLAQLGADSRGRVYSDRFVLEKGLSETSGNLAVEANTLRIAGDSSRVFVSGKTVQVAALTSPVTVSTSTGVQVAKLMPGKALAFSPQDSGATPAGQAPGTTPPSVPGGPSKAVVVVAGILVLAGIGATAGVLATQGESDQPISISPGR